MLSPLRAPGLRDLLLAAVVTAIFYFVATFTLIQSVLLTVALFYVYGDLRVRFPRPLTPFSVVIEPRWDQLLKDHGGPAHEKWKELARNAPANSVLRVGVSFTVLERNLVYVANQHSSFIAYSALIDAGLSAPIGELASSTDDIPGWAQTPSFYTRITKAGCQLSVMTPETYRRSLTTEYGSAEVILAILPAETFLEFLWPDLYDWNSNSGFRRRRENSDRRRIRLVELGWTQSEDWLPMSFYEHKYARIWVRVIE